jgi:hypothetical protein
VPPAAVASQEQGAARLLRSGSQLVTARDAPQCPPGAGGPPLGLPTGRGGAPQAPRGRRSFARGQTSPTERITETIGPPFHLPAGLAGSDAIFGRSKPCPRAGGLRALHRLSGCASIICGVGSGRLLDQNFPAFQRQIRRFGAQTVSWAGSTLPHRQGDPRCVPSQSQPRELQRIGAINPPMLLLDQVAVISK